MTLSQNYWLFAHIDGHDPLIFFLWGGPQQKKRSFKGVDPPRPRCPSMFVHYFEVPLYGVFDMHAYAAHASKIGLFHQSWREDEHLAIAHAHTQTKRARVRALATKLVIRFLSFPPPPSAPPPVFIKWIWHHPKSWMPFKKPPTRAPSQFFLI